MWLSGRALRQLRKRLWVRFPGNTCTNENLYPECNCESLWIKASAKCINVNVKFHQLSKNLGVCTCVAFVFKDSLLSSVFTGKGFSEVADWLRVQESLKWALVLGWFCRVLGWLSLANAT